MQRRQLIHLCAATLTALVAPAPAQQSQRIRRIGWLSNRSATSVYDCLIAFRQGMTALEWSGARDYAIDAPYVDGNTAAHPALADALMVLSS